MKGMRNQQARQVSVAGCAAESFHLAGRFRAAKGFETESIAPTRTTDRVVEALQQRSRFPFSQFGGDGVGSQERHADSAVFPTQSTSTGKRRNSGIRKVSHRLGGLPDAGAGLLGNARIAGEGQRNGGDADSQPRTDITHGDGFVLGQSKVC